MSDWFRKFNTIFVQSAYRLRPTLLRAAFVTLVTIFAFTQTTSAQFNPEINYQGKLTDNVGVAVSDGDYHMKFYLYDAPSGGTLLWSEDHSLATTTRVPVQNGLFSVMLGTTTSLSSVDFNQTMYLEVEIGGTSSSTWETLLPRKVLGAVPAAFVAEDANTLSGIASSSFLRSDAPDEMSATSASTLLTITQSGAGDILNINDAGTEVFTILDGGNVGIGTSSPFATLSVAGNIIGTGTLDIQGSGTSSITYLDVLQLAAGVVTSGTWNADVIGVAYGGTGTSTYATGDLIYADAPNSLTTLGAGADNLVLKLSGGVPTWAIDQTGAGGSGLWATTTGELLIYPNDTTDVVVIGANATTTDGTLLEVAGSALFRGSLTLSGITATSGTSSFQGISATGLAVTGSATSTFANGINIADGCFSVNGTCLSSGVSDFLSLSDTPGSHTANAILHGNAAGDGLTQTSTFVFDGSRLGIGTSTPDTMLHLYGASNGIKLSYDTDNYATLSVNSQGQFSVVGSGSTPSTMILGSGTAVDVVTLLDGNGIDFYMGIDDTDDTLKIGVGSEVGTNTLMSFTQSTTTIENALYVASTTATSTFANGIQLLDGCFRDASGTCLGQGGDTVVVVAANDSAANEKALADYTADGVADEATIQAAIDYVATNGGGEVRLLAGNFAVGTTTYSTSVITMATSTSLIGQGSSTLLTLDAGSADNIAMIMANTTHGIHIEGLHLEGNRANNTYDNQNGITFTNTSSSTIDHLTVNDFQDHGIHLKTGSRDNVIKNSVFSNNEDYGLYSQSDSNGNTILHSRFEQNGSFGVYLASSYNNIEHSVIRQSSSHGIYIANTSYNSISNNTISGNVARGIYLALSSDRNRITGNSFYDNNQGVGGSSIEIANSSSYNVVSNNIISATSSNPLIALSASAVTSNVIIGNVYDNPNTTTYVSDTGTDTRYNEWDRTTITSDDERNYDLLSIAGSSTGAALSATQYSTGSVMVLYDGATEVFTVLDGGNVGVGTSSPYKLLSVAGEGFFEGPIIVASTTATSTFGGGVSIASLNVSGGATSTFANGINIADGCFSVNGNCIDPNAASTFLGLTDTPGTYTAEAIPFVNAGGTALTQSGTFVFDGTNLGIGTANPNAQLDIFGTSNTLRMSYDVSNYTELSVDSGGQLSISSSNGTASNLELGSGIAEDLALLLNGNAIDWYLGLDDTDDNFKIGTGSEMGTTSVLVIDGTTGNVGIGSSSPLAKLSVDGDIWASTTTAAIIDRGGQLCNVEAYGAVGDDSTDNHAAIMAAINDCPLGGIVFFPMGTYRVSDTITIDKPVTLEGSYAPRWYYASTPQSAIKPTAGFTGTTSLIHVRDQSISGEGSPNNGGRFVNLGIDGNSFGAGLDGIYFEGLVRDWKIENVDISQTTGNGFHAAQGAGSGNPRGFTVTGLSIYSPDYHGFRATALNDSYLEDVLTVGGAQRGFYLSSMGETKIVGSRAVFNALEGLYIDGHTNNGGLQISDFSTDRNDRHGVRISAYGTSSIVFTNLLTRRDGEHGNGGGTDESPYAGVAIIGSSTAYAAPVVITGLSQIVGVDDDGAGTSSPAVGVRAEYAEYVNVDGLLWGVDNAYQDLGNNKHFVIREESRLKTGWADTRAVTIHNQKWVATSSALSYLLTNVGIGTTSPVSLLSVAGDITATGSIYIQGVGTSTITGGLSTAGLAVTGSATSTFANGINIADGCFSVNGTCLSSGASDFLSLSDTPGSHTANAILHGNAAGDGLTQTSTFVFDGSRLGIGTSTPDTMLHLYGASNGIKLSYDADNYATLSVNSQGQFSVVGSGSTPSTMILGSGTAVDVVTLLDGNGIDFYMGIDDTDDTLKIGLGQEVGTTTLIDITSATTTFYTALYASTTATSTFNNGIILSDGCFQDASGNCVGGAFTSSGGFTVLNNPGDYVGIGTSSPFAALSIEGDLIATGTIDIQGSGTSTINYLEILQLAAGTVTSGTWNGDVIDVAYGGTGTSTYAAGDIIYADGANSLTTLSAGADNLVLKLSGGVPVWGVDQTGAGGSGLWATSSNEMIIYPNDTNDVVVIGASATSTSGNLLEVAGDALFRGSLTLTGITATSGTSSFQGLSATGLAVTGSATSTFANGINIADGCFSVNGNCIDPNAASTFLGLTDTPGTYTAEAIPFVNAGGTALTQSGTFVFDGTNLGIGTANPNAQLDIFGTSNTLRMSYDVSNYTELSVDSGGQLSISSSNGTASNLELGSGIAEDLALLLNGNAIDWYLGLDDTDDNFKIGTGSEMGTSTLIDITSATTTFYTALYASTTATSTFTNGITLTDGCFQDASGTCLSNDDTVVVVAASNSSAAEKAQADYIADGTDDEVEINAALAALPATGGRVNLLAGTYSINNTISIVATGTALVGQGANTVLQATATTTDWDVIYASYVPQLYIAGLHIDGSASAGTDMEGIELVGTGSSTIDNVSVVGVRGTGIRIAFADGSRITNSSIYNADKYGVEINNTTHSIFSGNNSSDNGWEGIALVSSADHNTITGNTFLGNDDGIFLYLAEYNTVTGNAISSTTDYAIQLEENSNRNTISGNAIEGSGIHGLFVLNSHDNVLTGNALYDNGGSGSNSSVFIRGDRNLISNNRIVDTAGTGGAIEIFTGRTDNVIAGNFYSGAGATDIIDNGTGTEYTELDRITLNTTDEETFDILSIVGSTTQAALAITQASTGTILTLNSSTTNDVLTVTGTGALVLASGATTTADNGINITDGCFSVNGTCIGGASGAFTSSGGSTYLTTQTDNVGIGTSSPYAKLSVWADTADGSQVFLVVDSASTSLFSILDNGNMSVGNGSIYYTASTSVTAISNLQLGATNFADNAGAISWVDMMVDSTVATGTTESYTAYLDGMPMLTIFGRADGQGGVASTSVGIGTTTPSAYFAVDGEAYFSGPLTIASTTGTSTFANGITLSDGCFQDASGNCLSNDDTVVVVAAANSSAAEKAQADYVADGTNDEDEIQQAIDYVYANGGGGTVHLLAGTFTVGTTTYTDRAINMATSTRLVGQGDATIIKLANGHNVSVNVIEANNVEGVSVANLSIDGNGSTQAAGTYYGIAYDYVGTSTIENVLVANAQDRNIVIDSSNDIVLTHSALSWSSYGVEVLLSERIRITDNSFPTVISRPIRIDTSSDVVVAGNVIEWGEVAAVVVTDSPRTTVINNVVKGFSLNSGSVGIAVYDASDYSTVSGNVLESRSNENNAAAIYLSNVSHLSITGNTVAKAARAIWHTGGSDVTISGNQFANLKYEGIYLDGVTNDVVDSNTLNGAAWWGSGYSALNLSNADDSVISNNNLYATSADVIVSIDGSSERNVFVGNILENPNHTMQFADSGVDTRYTQWDRTTITSDNERTYDLLSIAGSSTGAALSATQYSTGSVMVLYDGATEVFTVLDGGNVGVGTSSPYKLLSVAGEAFFEGPITVASSTGTSTFAQGINITDGCFSVNGSCLDPNAASTFLGLSDTPGSHTANAILHGNAAGDGLTQTSTFVFDGSRLGIGTSTPDTMLHLYGASNGIKLSYDADNYATLSVNSQGQFSVVGSGSTPSTMILGSGTAVDVVTLLDGNAIDFYMGIDDTDDTLKIGLGAEVGTTTLMDFTQGTTTIYNNLFVASTTATSTFANGIQLLNGCFRDASGSCIGGSSGDTVVVVAANDSSATEKALADYIADGTNDEVQIQQAIDYASSTGGGTVHLLAGTFTVGTTTYSDRAINMATSTRLVGQGGETIIKLQDNHDASISIIEADYVEKVAIENLVIDGNGGLQGAGIYTGIYYLYTASSTIRNVHVENVQDDGIYTWASNNVLISEISASSNGNNGLEIGSAVGGSVLDSIFAYNGSSGIYLNTTDDIDVVGVSAYSNQGGGIEIYDGAYNQIAGGRYDDNAWSGILLSDLSDNNTISGNQADGNTTNGIYIRNGQQNTIVGNTLTRNGGDGMDLFFSGGDDNTVSGNTFAFNGENGLIVNTSDNNTVSGNTFTSNSWSGLWMAFADNNSVTGNTFYGNGTAGVHASIGLNTSDNNVISSNAISATSTDPLITLTSSASDSNVIASNQYTNPDTTVYVTDSGTDTRYNEWDRTTITTDNERTYDLFSIAGSSTGAALSATQYSTGSVMVLYDGATEVFTVLDGGNVGVGTSSPYKLLSVAGEAHFDGPLTVASSTGTSTFANGINLTDGCFSVGGSCLALGSATYLGLSDTPSSFTTNAIPYTNGAGDQLLHSSTFVYTGSKLGIGTAAPSSELTVIGEVLATNFVSTSTTATSTFEIASISHLEVGAQSFEDDAGLVQWVDLNVTDAAATSTYFSYSAELDDNPMITVSGAAIGDGTVGSTTVQIGTSTPVYSSNLPGTSFLVTNGVLCVDDGDSSCDNSLRQRGWLYGTNFAMSGTGTSTIAGGLDVGRINVTGSATSTFANGIDIADGCFSVNGTCLSTGGGGAFTSAGGNTTLNTIGDEVGIGSSSPFAKLVVQGDAGQNNPLFSVASSSNESYLTVTADGSLGLGTTTPSKLLQLYGANSPAFRITDSTNDVHFEARSEDSQAFLGTMSGHDLRLIAGGSSKVTVTTGGNVGIGTTTPVEMLSVAGNIVGTGTIAVQGSGTSTFTGGLQAAALNVTGSATSTFANGIDLADGCFSVNGTCLDPNAASTFLGLSDTPGSHTTNAILHGNAAGDGLTQTSTFVFDGSRLGIGTSTPDTMLHLYGASNGIKLSYDDANYAVLSVDSQGKFSVTGSAGANTTLRIGDGSAVDILALYDGNAQDFYLGLDDSDDTLKLGTGSEVGTNTLMSFTQSTTTIANALYTSSTTATSVIAGNLQVQGYFKVGTSSTWINSYGTSSFGGPIETTALYVTGGANATSTFSNGINLTDGCFSVNGTCIGGGATTFLALTDTPSSYTAEAIPFVNAGGTALTQSSTFVFDGTNLGIGTAAPNAQLDIFGTSNTLRMSYDVSNYAELSVDSAGQLAIVSSNSTASDLKLGIGNAEDLSLLLDGNAADFYLGLDDSDDTFKIGSGLEMGTSSLIELTTSTTTFLTGIYASTTATSTFANGIQLLDGCFRDASGSCIGSGSGGDTVVVVAANDSPATEKAFADYIADGTNDEVQIQQAIDYASSTGGGTVHLLAGTFTVGTTTYTDRSINMATSTRLVGQGEATVIKLRDNHNADVKLIVATSTQNVYVGNLTLNGNKGNQTAAHYAGVWLSTASSSYVENVHVYDVDDEGIFLWESTNNIIANNVSHNNLDGVIAWSSTKNKIQNNTTYRNTGRGIFLYLNSDDNVIEGNVTRNNAWYGIALSASSNGNVVANNVVSDNTWDGISIVGSNNNTITGNMVENNSNGAAYSSIYLSNSDDNLISGNTITATSTDPLIEVTNSTSDRNVIVGNTYINSDTTTYVTDNGTNTRYTQWDRTTITTDDERGYSLLAITGSTSSSTLDITQQGVGDILALNSSTTNGVLTVTGMGALQLASGATTTADNGINITDGCFSVNGTCLTSGGASTYLALTDTPGSFTANAIPYTNGAGDQLLHDATFVYTGSKLGIGTAAPSSELTVIGEVLATNFVSTSTTATSTFEIASISHLEVGAQSFEDDAGLVQWVDLNVTDQAATSTSFSYTAQLDDQNMLTISGAAIGDGTVGSTTVQVGTSSPLYSSNLPGTSFLVTNGVLCVDDGDDSCDNSLRQRGWLYGTNFAMSGTGTSTIAGGLDVGRINVTGSATSTFANGINIADGCFSVNGTCLSTGGGGAFTSATGFTTLSNADDFVGIGTTSPDARLTVGSSTPSKLAAGNYYNSAYVSGALEVEGLSYQTGGFISYASSTLLGDFNVVGNATTSGRIAVTGTGTSTITNGLSVGSLAVTGATSTFTNGIITSDLTANVLSITGGATSSFTSGVDMASLNVTGATSTFTNGIITSDLTTNMLTVTGSGTSTFTGGISGASLNISGSATSTFANGINIADGCFSVNGTCLTTGGASTYLSLTDTPGSFTANAIPYTNGAADQLLHSSTFVFNGTNLGIGTANPQSKLSVIGEVLATNFVSTSTTATSTFEIASISHLEVGAQSFEKDAGIVQWVDMDVSSAAATGTYYSYNAQLDDLNMLSISGVSLGNGQIGSTTVQVGTSTPLYSSNLPGTSFLVTNGVLCVDDGDNSCDDSLRQRGWLYGVNFAMSGTGTSTIAGGLQTGALSVTGTATSTYANGIDLADGCFSVNGTCIGGGGGVFTSAGGYTYVNNGENVGIGTTTPIAKLTVMGDVYADYYTATSSTATSTFTNVTIDHLEVGPSRFDDDAGILSWVDMSVTSGSASGTAMQYAAQIDGNRMLTVYGQADGAGNLVNKGISIGTSTILTNENIPWNSLIVGDGIICIDNGGDNCDDASRAAGTLIAVNTTVTGIDVAENFPTRDKQLQPGQIVMLDEENNVFVKRYDMPEETYSTTTGTTTPRAPVSIGIVSSEPGVTLGGFKISDYKDETLVPIALAGRVPVKVTGQNGPILPGDRIAPGDRAGYGVKAVGNTPTVGIALESFDGDQGAATGEIVVFVTLAYSTLDPDISGGTIATVDGVEDSAYWQLSEATGAIKYIAPIDMNGFSIENVSAIRGLASGWSLDENGLLVTQEVQTEKLCLGDTCVTENELQALLDNANVAASAPGMTPVQTIPEPPVEEAATTTATTTDETATSTDQTATTTDQTATSTDDTIPPSISLNGTWLVEVPYGDDYIDLGATASDETDGDLTNEIYTTGLPIDTFTPGSYTVTYSVSDAAGNTAETTRTVIVQENPDITPPDITLIGEPVVQVDYDSVYTDAGATALDDIDGDITDLIQTTGLPIDTQTPGEYTITYSVEDAAGNLAVPRQRIVTVGEAPTATTTPAE